MKKFIQEWFAEARALMADLKNSAQTKKLLTWADTKWKSVRTKKSTEMSLLPEIVGVLITALIIASIPSLHSKGNHSILAFLGLAALIGLIVLIIGLMIKYRKKLGIGSGSTTSIAGWSKAVSLLGTILLIFLGLAALGTYLNSTQKNEVRERELAYQRQHPPVHCVLRYYPHPGEDPVALRAEIVRDDDLRFEAWVYSTGDKGLDGTLERSHFLIDKLHNQGEWSSTRGRAGRIAPETTSTLLSASGEELNNQLLQSGKMSDGLLKNASFFHFEFVRVD